ncbi:MAG: hypothetical protein LJE59_07380 [Chromatiaceae bacterium]|jgi:hypothetical protein|nr:hypothetical protein [Chromatiaceae bacterium]
MSRTTPSPCSRMPLYRFLRHLCGAALLCLLSPWVQAAEDAYLQQLNREVTKVEAAPTDTQGDGGALATQKEGPRAGQALASRADFEASLKDQHVGTYSFYRRLPERSREEIFLDYSAGASMEDLRGKIIDRYLHP